MLQIEKPTNKTLMSTVAVWLQSRVSTNLTEQISRRFQEGFQEKSRTCLHCFGLLCNVPNLLVCLNITKTWYAQHRTVAKINNGDHLLNEAIRYPVLSCVETNAVDHRHFIQNFQEDHTNSRRLPGFPRVVDTLQSILCQTGLRSHL